MVTGYEVEAYNNISLIARNLNRIANCLEANEKRAREHDATPLIEQSSSCSHAKCRKQVIVTINGRHWCLDHVDEGFREIRATVEALEGKGK